MSSAVLILWLEGVDPEMFSAIPSLIQLARSGVDVRLTPMPLVEKSVCSYQALTGMGAGKFGRFDRVRPESYTAIEEPGIPDGAAGHLLPDVLSARKLAVRTIEVQDKEALDVLAGQQSDCTIVRFHPGQTDVAAVDTLVQRCIELAGAQTHLVVLTDVYIPAPLKFVNMNDFLADAGLLEVGEPRSNAGIAWDETLAYSLGTGQIWINLRGREPKGCVNPGREYQLVCEALIEELCSNWLDQETHEHVVDRVVRKEDAYTGDYLFKAPDLTVVFRPGFAASPNAFALDFDGASVRESGSSVHLEQPHARLIASGPCLNRGTAEEASLIDVAPTILYLLGQAIPTRIDGSIITSLFTEAYLQQTRIERSDTDALSDEDQDLVVERLRDLGYLG